MVKRQPRSIGARVPDNGRENADNHHNLLFGLIRSDTAQQPLARTLGRRHERMLRRGKEGAVNMAYRRQGC
jgi:hypothetical protein